MKRFQFVWYDWRGPWFRMFIEKPFYKGIYRWRIALGPLDIRRWA